MALFFSLSQQSWGAIWCLYYCIKGESLTCSILSHMLRRGDWNQGIFRLLILFASSSARLVFHELLLLFFFFFLLEGSSVSLRILVHIEGIEDPRSKKLYQAQVIYSRVCFPPEGNLQKSIPYFISSSPYDLVIKTKITFLGHYTRGITLESGLKIHAHHSWYSEDPNHQLENSMNSRTLYNETRCPIKFFPHLEGRTKDSHQDVFRARILGSDEKVTEREVQQAPVAKILSTRKNPQGNLNHAVKMLELYKKKPSSPGGCGYNEDFLLQPRNGSHHHFLFFHD